MRRATGSAAPIRHGWRDPVPSSVVFGGLKRAVPQRSEEPSDEELMARIVGRDGQAFAVLVERLLPRLLALAQAVLGNPAEADDVAQEAFLRIWTHADRWDRGRALLTTWLHRIVVNLCLDRLRKVRPAALGEEANEVPDPGESAFDAVASREARALLQAALDRLPPRQRLALGLFYFHDLDLRSSAAAMKLSPAAFEILLRRARGALKDGVTRRTSREALP